MPNQGPIWIAVVVLGLLLFTPAVVTGTAPEPPASYYGQVLIDDEPADAGIEVTAYIDGTERGSIETDANGSFGGPETFDEKLDVRGSSDDNGESVRFTIGNAETNVSVRWSPGDHEQLTLVIDVPVVGSSENPPTDPDGDGNYEDINGDGIVDIVDVQALYAHRRSAEIKNHPRAFDYNDNGAVDIVDIQRLYVEQQAS